METEALVKGIADQVMKGVNARLEPIENALKQKATDNAGGIVRGAPGIVTGRKSSKHGEGADKLQGKGIEFARFAKCVALGVIAHRSPQDIAKDFGFETVAKALAESTMQDGGALVPDEYSADFIEILRARAVVRASGPTTVPMNSGSLSMGRQNSAGTASYVGENQAAAPTQQQFGALQFSAKKLMALTPISNDLLRDAAFSADALVRNDLVKVTGLREDLAFLRGDGTVGTPKGIRNIAASGNVFAATQGGAKATLDEVLGDLSKMIRLVEESNVAMVSPVWYMTPRSKWFLKTLRDNVGNFYFREELSGPNPTLLGYPVYTTTQIPQNLGGGTESEVYFGEASEQIIAENTQLVVQAFPGGAYVDSNSTVVSGISSDQTVIQVIERHDFNLRHTTSFSVLTTVKWGA